MYSSYNSLYTSFLYHSGVKGMKWGIRRKAVMNDVLKKGSELGVSKVTLEVPGISPDARHIYEKIGFKKNKRISNEDDVWGGLTSMTYKYKNGGKH